jgi:hypothetical protein
MGRNKFTDAVNALPEDLLCRLSHELSLGLDEVVPLFNYVEAAADLLEAIEAHGWIISPPACGLHSSDNGIAPSRQVQK